MSLGHNEDANMLDDNYKYCCSLRLNCYYLGAGEMKYKTGQFQALRVATSSVFTSSYWSMRLSKFVRTCWIDSWRRRAPAAQLALCGFAFCFQILFRKLNPEDGKVCAQSCLWIRGAQFAGGKISGYLRRLQLLTCSSGSLLTRICKLA